MLVDAMTKNMKDQLLQVLMQTGCRWPQEYEVFTPLDAFYFDTSALCLKNACPCLQFVLEDSPVPWWHLPVSAPVA